MLVNRFAKQKKNIPINTPINQFWEISFLKAVPRDMLDLFRNSSECRLPDQLVVTSLAGRKSGATARTCSLKIKFRLRLERGLRPPKIRVRLLEKSGDKRAVTGRRKLILVDCGTEMGFYYIASIFDEKKWSLELYVFLGRFSISSFVFLLCSRM